MCALANPWACRHDVREQLRARPQKEEATKTDWAGAMEELNKKQEERCGLDCLTV